MAGIFYVCVSYCTILFSLTITSNESLSTESRATSGTMLTSREHFTAPVPSRPATIVVICENDRTNLIKTNQNKQLILSTELNLLTPARLKISTDPTNSISSAPGGNTTIAVGIFKRVKFCDKRRKFANLS